MKFKVGDKVRVVKGGYPCGISAATVDEYIDKGILTISKVVDDCSCMLEDDNYYWDESMLELVEEAKTTVKYVTVKSSTIQKYIKKIGDLETKVKSKQSRIDYLEGQLDVFKESTKWLLEAILSADVEDEEEEEK